MDEYTKPLAGHEFRYNVDEGVNEFDSDVTSVTNQLGLEDWTRVYNDSGATILNGKAVYIFGVYDDKTTTVRLASNTDEGEANRTIGLVTADIPNNSYGFVTTRGYVRDIDTSSLTVYGAAYLGVNGNMTMTKPTSDETVIVMGGLVYSHATEGIFQVGIYHGSKRSLVTKSYSFTSQGVGAGAYFKAGFYDYSTTDANLTQASATVTYGTSDQPYSAHAFVVCGGAGTVNTGVVGLQVSGTSINDAGTLTASDSEIIIADITAVATDEYYEGKKFVGTVTFELVTISGSPTTYALDFNYGYCKYEDFGNKDFYVTDIECLWYTDGADSSFDIEFLHHNSTGWTYSAAAFIAGNTPVAKMTTDLSGFSELYNNDNGAWKRAGFSQLINGSDSEGIIYRITTGSSNTIQTLDLHAGVQIS